jgi:hypothetical protein
MYEYIGILLGARPILHISRLKVKLVVLCSERVVDFFRWGVTFCDRKA